MLAAYQRTGGLVNKYQHKLIDMVDIWLSYVNLSGYDPSDILLTVRNEHELGHTIYSDVMPLQAKHLATRLTPYKLRACTDYYSNNIANHAYINASGGTVTGRVSAMRIVISARYGTVRLMLVNMNECMAVGHSVWLSGNTCLVVAGALVYYACMAEKQLPQLDLGDLRI